MQNEGLPGLLYFEDRFSDQYYDYLIQLLSDIDELARGGTAGSKSGIFYDKFEKGIRIDFCGLAATTLLGSNMGDFPKNKKRLQIKNLFLQVVNRNTTNRLNEMGIYLKVRFIFPYVYSSFSYSIIYSESSKNRPYTHEREIKYGFGIDEDLTQEQINASSLKLTQEESLKEIAAIAEQNPGLVMTRPEKSDNTMQVRFTLLPISLCCMICNNKAISDAYMFAQEITESKKRNLFYNYPVIVFDNDSELGKRHFKNIANHFDYIWNNDLTLLCKDTTEFDLGNNCLGLSVIRRPEDLVWTQKRNRIIEYLKNKKIPISQEEVEKWSLKIREKVLKYVIPPSTSPNVPDKQPGKLNLPTSVIKTSLHVTKENGEYSFNLELSGPKMKFGYSKKVPQLVFLVILHYAYAKLKGYQPVMHKLHPDGLTIFKHICNPLSNCNKNLLDDNLQPVHITGEFLNEYFFDANRNYQFKIEDIKFDANVFEWAKEITYGYVLKRQKNKVVIDKEKGIYPVLWFGDEDDILYKVG